jgi:DNA-binding transcriptional LysR family regulator
MDTVWLEDFICLARNLNFTRAADERNVTQPAFSRRIKSLENWLGTPVVERSTYPVKLSNAGLQLLPVAQETISKLRDTRQSIRELESGQNAFVRIAVLHTISVNYLSERIELLQHQLPELKVRVYSRHLRTCCQLFSEGACEFLLYYRHNVVAPLFDENAYQRKDIGKERLIPVANRKAAAEQGWELSETSTVPIPYLSYDPSTFLGMVVDQLIGKRKPPLITHYVDALTETLKRRALAGSGIAWLPEGSVSKELADGSLVILGDKDWETKMTLSIFCSPDRLDKMGKKIWELI